MGAETIDCLFSPLMDIWLLDWSTIGAHDAGINSPMSRRQTNPTPLDRKGRANTMMIEQIVTALAVAAVFIVPLVALAAAAMRFGVDSRPTIDERDRRPWLIPNA